MPTPEQIIKELRLAFKGDYGKHLDAEKKRTRIELANAVYSFIHGKSPAEQLAILTDVVRYIDANHATKISIGLHFKSVSRYPQFVQLLAEYINPGNSNNKTRSAEARAQLIYETVLKSSPDAIQDLADRARAAEESPSVPLVAAIPAPQLPEDAVAPAIPFIFIIIPFVFITPPLILLPIHDSPTSENKEIIEALLQYNILIADNVKVMQSIAANAAVDLGGIKNGFKKDLLELQKIAYALRVEQDLEKIVAGFEKIVHIASKTEKNYQLIRAAQDAANYQIVLRTPNATVPVVEAAANFKKQNKSFISRIVAALSRLIHTVAKRIKGLTKKRVLTISKAATEVNTVGNVRIDRENSEDFAVVAREVLTESKAVLAEPATKTVLQSEQVLAKVKTEVQQSIVNLEANNKALNSLLGLPNIIYADKERTALTNSVAALVDTGVKIDKVAPLPAKRLARIARCIHSVRNLNKEASPSKVYPGAVAAHCRRVLNKTERQLHQHAVQRHTRAKR